MNSSKKYRDILRIYDIVFQARHGCSSDEHEVESTFRVDIEVYHDQLRAATLDHLSATVDVEEVYRIVRETVQGTQRNLIETVAEEIAGSLLKKLNIDAVRVKLHKDRSSLPGFTRGYEVEILRP